ncbi:4-alpha-glucanotransferase [Pseudohalioglobus sediminis]|uniref:4-alpha-glucanotransferase n=1 Tax=Pseudohalioglobus sediminis TaxID=2606449 RepID=A0A5B0WSE7_9GAMM|nr:4-alpha-glucanotransferase [Pseudohalioglobus sediminis]KAA1189161.1 4-alpha-glucanotransferase [Pseudohalioglobus sediminis]
MPPFTARRAGVLLHPTSLPGSAYGGDFGAEARRFVDFLAAAGLSIWQMLPLGPTHDDGCPYQSSSVHAGNPDLINLDWLVERDLLEPAQAAAGRLDPQAKRTALDQAAVVFFEQLFNATQSELTRAYSDFTTESAFWLEDYVRFQGFRDAAGRQPWSTWEAGLRNCEPEACARRAMELADQLSKLRFRQFIFHRQWLELKQYANERGVLLFGDMPIYVHLESADVWAHQKQFDLDDNGQPLTVTGVPPDYFSAEGQLWGNPQYNWQYMLAHHFDWWLKRFTSAARMFDIVRIDHFRALEAYWEIPAGATSAIGGRWVHSPGRELLGLVREHCPRLRLVAENLGIISPEVEALREQFQLPGMLILQFAFDGNPENPYLLHRHEENDVVYTGTHDNDTSLGWFQSLDEATREHVCRYFECQPDDMPWAMIDRAMASPAATAIVPWQDLLGLDGRHRMNTPGTTEGNWHWRFQWQQVPEDLAPRTRQLLSDYNRLTG